MSRLNIARYKTETKVSSNVSFDYKEVALMLMIDVGRYKIFDKNRHEQ